MRHPVTGEQLGLDDALSLLVMTMYGYPSGGEMSYAVYLAGVKLALNGENLTADEVEGMSLRLVKGCTFRPAPCEYLSALRDYRREVYETGPAIAVTVAPALPGQAEVIQILRGPEAEQLIAERKAMEAQQVLPTPEEVAEYRRRLRPRFLEIVDGSEMPKEAEA